jgi:hypothetical protein
MVRHLAGLGESLDLIKRLCRDDPAALDAIDRVTARGPGNPEPSGHNQHTEKEVIDDNVNNCQGDRASPTGNSRAAALRRLRKDRPDLHEQVLKGEKTTNGG